MIEHIFSLLVVFLSLNFELEPLLAVIVGVDFMPVRCRGDVVSMLAKFLWYWPGAIVIIRKYFLWK